MQVVNAALPTEPLKYNHDASVAEFRGVWIVVWNGNTVPKEGAPNQFNLMATSTDLQTWSDAVPAFSSSSTAVNPVPCDATSCVQWQPNLFNLPDGRLGCVWSGSNGRDGRPDGNAGGTYLSILSDPHGKWENHLITFADNHGSPQPSVSGKNWTLFATQNPAVLRSGRILAPVVMTDASGAIAPGAPAGCKNGSFFWCEERRSSVLYSDDGGQTWQCSAGTSIPGELWANWEPTVWEDVRTNDVFMISRYNDFRSQAQGGPPPDERMRWAQSTTLGTTWSPLLDLPVDTVVSRAQVCSSPLTARHRQQPTTTTTHHHHRLFTTTSSSTTTP